MTNTDNRQFIGLELPDTVKRQLACLTTDLPGTRWQLEQDLHVTLRFLGQLSPPRRQAVQHLLQDIAVAPWHLQVRGVGHFNQRILWAGLVPSTRLHELKQQLDQGLQRLDLATDRHDYQPHITLARIKSGHQDSLTDFIATHKQLELPPWKVSHISLFESRNTAQGRYHVVERYPLPHTNTQE